MCVELRGPGQHAVKQDLQHGSSSCFLLATSAAQGPESYRPFHHSTLYASHIYSYHVPRRVIDIHGKINSFFSLLPEATSPVPGNPSGDNLDVGTPFYQDGQLQVHVYWQSAMGMFVHWDARNWDWTNLRLPYLTGRLK